MRAELPKDGAGAVDNSTIVVKDAEIREALAAFAELAASARPEGRARMLSGLRGLTALTDGIATNSVNALEVLAARPVSSEVQVRTLITQAGGIFIGKDELVRLDAVSAGAAIPDLPQGIEAFLNAKHPLRDGSIASHVILAFVPECGEWVCIDRGSGGRSDVVPGSLGSDLKGLPGDKQDRLLKPDGLPIQVLGASISSPPEYGPIFKALNFARALHFHMDRPLREAPFFDIYGRTADTAEEDRDCRIVVGRADAFGIFAQGRFPSNSSSPNVGLLAYWNLRELHS